MKKNGKKRGNAENFPAGTVVFPDGSIMQPEDWGKREPRKPRLQAKPITPPESVDAEEPVEDILEKYGKYLHNDGEPLKGINPNPKYYVVPKEEPEQPKSKTTVKIKVKAKKYKE